MGVRSGQRTTVPVLDPKREKAASGSGEVKTYRMSPEELEDYRARTGYKQPPTNSDGEKINPPVQQRTGGVRTQMAATEQDRRDGRKSANEPDKQAFLQKIASGMAIAAVERELGMTRNSLFYWVKKWNLNGITPGMARELLKETGDNMETKQAEPTTSPVDIEKLLIERDDALADLRVAHDRSKRLSAEVEQLKVANAEAVTLAGAAAEKLQAKIDDLRASEEELIRTLLAKERETAELNFKLESFQPSAGITLDLPLIQLGTDRFTQLKKVHEEFEEFGAELKPGAIDRRAAGSELLDLVQAYIGLIFAEMSDLVVDEAAVPAAVQAFFRRLNDEHLEKIDRYAAEREWTVIA
jgi:hypothetical protein